MHNLEKELQAAMAEQEEGSQADPPPAVQENLERAKTNIKNKADDLNSKTKKSAQDANEAISRTAKNAKAIVEKVAKDAQEALQKRSNDVSEPDDQEAYQKGPDEAAEGDEKHEKDRLAEDEQGEDSLIELEKEGDGPTDGEDTDKTVGSKKDAADSEHANADQGAQSQKGEKERSTDNKPTVKTDTKSEREAGKADEEWDPEDGHDAAAEAYEVEIDAMLTASEKRAEAELLPDNIS